MMVKIKANILLITILLSLSPWGLLDVCANHLEKHENDEHHGSCADGMMEDEAEDNRADDIDVLEALQCITLSPSTDEFKAPFPLKVTGSHKILAALIVLDLLDFNSQDQEYLLFPDPKSNSDPPLGVNALRGPPSV
jgi:hypothetical protein